MIYHGRELNAKAMWEALGVSIPESDSGTFSSLLFCPNGAHDNKRTPSFQVNLVKPLAHCFSKCGISGTYEHAVRTILGCTEREARKFILGFTRVALEGAVRPADGVRRRKSAGDLQELARDLERFERGEFTYLPKEARAYLDSRGIDQQARGRWQVGWDEDGGGDRLLAERLVIPARDHRGVVRFLIRRAIDGRQPKYVYSRGSAKTDVLFGLLQVPRNERILLLVEGSVDSIRRQLGGLPAVGTLGSGLSDRQVRLIYERDPERVYTMYDRDEAGVRNTLDACEKLSRIPVFVCRYPNGRSDPAELLHAEAERAIGRALPRHEFLRRVAKLSKTTPSRRRKEVIA